MFRAAKKAPGGGSRLVSPLSGCRSGGLVNGMRRDGTRLGRGRREVSGWRAWGCEFVDTAARSVPGFAGNFFSSSLAREMTYDIFLRGFCWLVSG